MKNSIYRYSCGNLIVAIVPFVLIPFMTKAFEPEEYGYITMFQLLLGLFSIFVGFSMNGPLLRYNYNEKITESRLSNYFFCSWLLFLLSTILILLILLVFGGYISHAFSVSERLIYTAFFTSIVYYPIKIRLGQWQANENSKLYLLAQITQSVLLVLGFFALYYFVFDDARSRIYSHILALACLSYMSVCLLIRDGYMKRGRFSLENSKDLLSQSFGVMPHLIGVYLISFADRFIVNKYIGGDYVGILMIAIQVSLVLNIVLDGLNKAVNPKLFRALRDDNYELKIKFCKWTYLFSISIILLSYPLSYLAALAVKTFTEPSYHEAAELVKITILSQLINGIYIAFVNYILYSKKLWVLSVISIFSGGVGITLSIYFVDEYGIQAIVYSSLFAAIMRTILVMIVATKLVRMPWRMAIKV